MSTEQISCPHRVKIVVEHVEDGYIAYPLTHLLFSAYHLGENEEYFDAWMPPL